MYSMLNSQVAQSRVADMHRQAQRDALARTARQSRRPGTPRPGRRLPALRALVARRLPA